MMRTVSINVNEYGTMIYIHRREHEGGISSVFYLRTPAQILRALWLAARLAERYAQAKKDTNNGQ